VKVHKLTNAFLSDFGPFGNHAQEVAEFITGSVVVAHNAPFDVAFIKAELGDLCPPGMAYVDTLEMSRTRSKYGKHTLESVCARYGISVQQDRLHGAQFDAELCAKVFFAMKSGAKNVEIEEGRYLLPSVDIKSLYSEKKQRPTPFVQLKKTNDHNNDKH
jgi:DNA polymerase-3 subunit epsilon